MKRQNTISRDICTPYHHLTAGIKEVKDSKCFKLILSYSLKIGNLLNNSDIKSFSIESLLKLSTIKESSSKKTLLYSILQKLPQDENVSDQFEKMSQVCKTDLSESEHSLESVEEQCKSALGYLKLAASYDANTKHLVESFLTESVKEADCKYRITHLLIAEDI